MGRNKGWDYLNSDDNSSLFEEDGNSGYQDEDGSGHFNGADGSWGYKDSDGSAHFNDADGSWGYRDADGSVHYNGSDGSWGYKNPDGSGYFSDSNGNSTSFSSYEESRNSFSSDDLDSNNDSNSSSESGSLGEALGTLASVVLLKKMNDRKERKRQEQEEQRIRELKYEEELKKQEAERKRKKAKKKEYRKKHWKAYLISRIVIFMLIGLAIFAAYRYYLNSQLIDIPYTDSYVIGRPIEEVESKLKTLGFNNVNSRCIQDLEYEQIENDNKVTKIAFNDDNKYASDKKHSKNCEIIIEYHCLKSGKIPFSNKEAKKMVYTEAIELLKKNGFVNIEIETNEDLIFGWINKDGEVDSISINENDKFEAGDNYRIDSKILIVYHTFKNKEGQ